MKYKLDGVAILIIFKADSEERLINLSLILEFLLRHFEVNIHILEAGKAPSLRLGSDGPGNVTYEFVADEQPTFHMTRYRNHLLASTSSEIIVHYDTDVIVNPASLFSIVNSIKDGSIDIGYPYDGRFYEVPLWFKRVYQKVRSYELLENYTDCLPLTFSHSLGGIFISGRSFYEGAGMENEKIVGWGPDDKDRFYKGIKAGARYKRAATPLYHLYHPVLPNSRPADHSGFIQNIKEFIKNLDQ